MTDELDEEWVVQEEDSQGGDGEGEDLDEGGSSSSIIQTPRKPSPLSIKSNNSIISSHSALNSLNKPRIPSSLRYALASNSSPARHAAHLSLPPARPSPGSENQSPTSSSAGTFVMRSTPGNSYKLGGGEDQLQAAARAMRGAQGGLGAPANEVEAGEVEVDKMGGKGGMRTPGRDKLGLMSLFEAGSPPQPPPPGKWNHSQAIRWPRETRFRGLS